VPAREKVPEKAVGRLELPHVVRDAGAVILDDSAADRVVVVDALARRRTRRDQHPHVLPVPQDVGLDADEGGYLTDTQCGHANTRLPTPSAAVTLTAFAQVARPVPTFAIVRGVRKPARVLSSMTTFLVRHPTATFLIDPAICDDIRDRVLPQLPQPMRAVVTCPR
jgi:hypothetical protein